MPGTQGRNRRRALRRTRPPLPFDAGSRNAFLCRSTSAGWRHPWHPGCAALPSARDSAFPDAFLHEAAIIP